MGSATGSTPIRESGEGSFGKNEKSCGIPAPGLRMRIRLRRTLGQCWAFFPRSVQSSIRFWLGPQSGNYDKKMMTYVTNPDQNLYVAIASVSSFWERKGEKYSLARHEFLSGTVNPRLVARRGNSVESDLAHKADVRITARDK
jgi:hypothetical protein